MEFACQTEKDRIIIDQPKDETLRYRMWHKPHSLLDKPDAEIKNGQKEFHGTGPCVYSSWSFTQGGSKVIVEGTGCSSGDQPEDAVGTIGATDEQRDPVWCY